MKLSYLVLSVFFLGAAAESFSQGTPILTRESNKFFLGFSISPQATNILLNSSDLNLNDIQSAGKKNISGSVEVGYMLSKYFGISSGLSYSGYSSSFALDSYEITINSIDADNDSYSRIIEGNQINEAQKLSTIEIPLTINLVLPLGNKIAFYITPGIGLCIPVSHSFKSSGTFSYKGYYPAYFVTLEDAKVEGFLNNQNVRSDGELKLKSIFPDMTAAAGFSIRLNEKSHILIGINVKNSISNISDYGNEGDFILSTESTEIHSLAGGSNISPKSMGLSAGFRHFF